MTNTKQYDIERMGLIFSDIRRYFEDLESLSILHVQDLDDKRNFYAASMILFSLINRILDLGSEMVIANNLGVPSTYREIFILLQKDGTVNADLAREMGRLVTYRNLLSHEYQGITSEQVFELLGKVELIKKFVLLLQNKIHDQT